MPTPKKRQTANAIFKRSLLTKAKSCSRKKVIMFDMDGTLAESKASIDPEMEALLCRLLEKHYVAVASGGNWKQFQNQLIRKLRCTKERFAKMFILPTSGASLYRNDKGKWVQAYDNHLTAAEKKKVFAAFEKAYADITYVPPKKIYGKVVEDRESQITFSAAGQRAPLEAKEDWHANADVRFKLKRALEKYLPDFKIRLGGLTSVDVTKKGIDKAYGIRQLMKILRVNKNDIAYVGDALFPGGNDHVVKSVGIATVPVRNAEDTKYFIDSLLSFQ